MIKNMTRIKTINHVGSCSNLPERLDKLPNTCLTEFLSGELLLFLASIDNFPIIPI